MATFGHKIRRNHFLVYFIVLVILLVSSIASYFSYKNQSERSLSTSIPGSDPNTKANGVALGGQIVNIDTTSGTVSINWLYFAAGTFTNDTNTFAPNLNLKVFQDGAATPVGTFIARIASSGLVAQSFSTKHLLASDTSGDSSNTISYPFDTYSAGLVFSVQASDTNTSVPLIIANLFGSFQGFVARSTDTSVSYIGATAALDNPSGRSLQIDISRSTVVKGFAVLLIIVSWAISLMVIYVTLHGTIFGAIVTPALLTAPASILFALPALRNLQPNVPTFGTYSDVYSFMITEIIVALCFVSLIVVHVARSKFPDFPK